MPTISAEARLRPRSQLTLPESIVAITQAQPGDRFVVEVEADDPGTVRLRRVRESYAGALEGLYGDAGAYLDLERDSWHKG